MALPIELQYIDRPEYRIELFVPDAEVVQGDYLRHKRADAETPFPHWTKLWPAGLAMADFIQLHPELVQNKNVLELAAGLGLPAFVAARYAKAVCCSDYLDKAVEVMARSAAHLGLGNVECRVLDWNDLPAGLRADVLVLSDINYDPSQFDRLYQVLEGFLRSGSVVLLSTPQRLMAKPFIERLLPFCREQEEMMVDFGGQATAISLLVLEAPRT